MLTSFEISGLEARAKHCRTRLKLASNDPLRNFLTQMLEEAEKPLKQMRRTRAVPGAKVRRKSHIFSR